MTPTTQRINERIAPVASLSACKNLSIIPPSSFCTQLRSSKAGNQSPCTKVSHDLASQPHWKRLLVASQTPLSTFREGEFVLHSTMRTLDLGFLPKRTQTAETALDGRSFIRRARNQSRSLAQPVRRSTHGPTIRFFDVSNPASFWNEAMTLLHTFSNVRISRIHGPNYTFAVN